MYCGIDLIPAVRRADSEGVWLDPEADRARVAEVLRVRRSAETPQREPWPEPEVPMRVIEAGAAPSSVARLLNVLRGAGWRSVATYARGTGFDAQRRPGKVVGSFSLRAARGNRRAVVIWHQDAAGKLTSRGVLVWGDRHAEWIGVQEFERGL